MSERARPSFESASRHVARGALDAVPRGADGPEREGRTAP